MSTKATPMRCAQCNKFVTDGQTEYWDVEIGGCRGSEPASPYCSEACAEKAYKQSHHTSTGEKPKWCICEVTT